MNEDIINFLKQLEFENELLTSKSKELINQQVQRTQLKGYFNLVFWKTEKVIQSLFDYKEIIVFLEYIIYEHINRIVFKDKLKVYNLLLHCKLENSNHHNGLELVNQIEKVFDKNSIDYVETLNLKGKIYSVLGRFKMALESFYNALDLIEKLGDYENKNEQLFYTNNNLGVVYLQQKEFENAKKIFEKNIQKQDELGNKFEVSISYMNVANVYSLQENIEKTLHYDLKSKELKKELGDKKGEERININIAETYLSMHDLVNSKKYTELCKNSDQPAVRDAGIRLDLRIALEQFEQLKTPSKKDRIAIYSKAQESLESANKSEVLKHKVGNYPFIAKAFKYANDYEKAFFLLEKRYELYEKYVEEQKVMSYNELRESHEIELRQKEIEKKEVLNIKLKQVNSELEQFTAMASHDLKSPLRNISAFCSLLEDEDTTKEEIKEYTNLIKADTTKMSKLISSLLNYSKIGFNEIEMETIDLNNLLEEVIKGLQQEIKTKNATVSFAALPKLKGNALLLHQLFNNLISNALKYNDKEHPEIIIKTTKNQNEIEVSDNGIGIPENKINDVFKAFTRAHSGSKYEGSGVGLATCKKIMDIHKGSITVSSEVGKGSVFTLIF